MEDKTLIRISFAGAVIGIAIIIVLGQSIDLEESRINSINKFDIGKNVKIKGFIENVKTIGSIRIIELEDDTGKIEVVLFGKEGYFKKGNIAEIEGQVSIREGKIQINADRVKVFSL